MEAAELTLVDLTNVRGPGSSADERLDCESHRHAAEEEGSADEDGSENESWDAAAAQADAARLEAVLREEAGQRKACGLFPTPGGGKRCCNYDAYCYSRNPSHWASFAHPKEMEKPYCEELLQGKQCYD
jgi:hypothetical protein